MNPVLERVSSETLRVSGVSLEVVRRGTSGRPLLFLHPGDGMDVMAPFLVALAQDARLVAPFHPGFGHSQLPDEFRSVEDLAYLYLDMLEQEGLEDVILVGAGLGAWIAIEVAVRSTRRLGALVLSGPVGVRFGQATESDFVDVNMLSEAEVMERLYLDPAQGHRSLSDLSDDELLVISRNRLANCLFTWSPYMHNPRLKRWLHRINVPTLVMTGAQDRFLAHGYAQRLASAIPGARHVSVADAGHYPHVEQPGRFAAAVLQFACAND